MDVTELRAARTARRGVRTRGARRARRVRPAARTPRLQAIIDAYPDADGLALHRGRCRSPRPASTAAPPSARATARLAPGCSAPPTSCCPPATPPSPRSSGSTSRACGCCCWPGPPATLDDPEVAPAARGPPRWSSWSSGCGPDAADTLRYFAEQGVAAKVISGDNAVSVGAVAGKLGLPGRGHPVDARTLPADRDGDGRRRSTRTRSSAGSPRSRSGTWSARSSPAATRSR